jgi:hypothetical protein
LTAIAGVLSARLLNFPKLEQLASNPHYSDYSKYFSNKMQQIIALQNTLSQDPFSGIVTRALGSSLYQWLRQLLLSHFERYKERLENTIGQFLIDELGRLMSKETGKVTKFARDEIISSLYFFELTQSLTGR